MRTENSPLFKLGAVTALIASSLVHGFFHDSGAKTPEPLTTAVVKEDIDYFRQIINNTNGIADRQASEKEWVQKTFPAVREGLINLYEAQEKNPGSVKIAFTDFVKPNEIGEDMGKGPVLHVVKSFENKLSDGKIQRIYVNEHWPLNLKTGSITLPSALRVRVQAFDGSPHQKDANDLFASDTLQITWEGNNSASFNPLFARQHFYSPFDFEKGDNGVNQVETFIDSHPYSCQSCHDARRSHGDKGFSLSSLFESRNYSAITQDKEFNLPVKEQKGYQRLATQLNSMVQSGQISKSAANETLAMLENKGAFLPPNMASSLVNVSIPWLDSDYQASDFHNVPGRFVYEDGNAWVKAIYGQYKTQVSNVQDSDLDINSQTIK